MGQILKVSIPFKREGTFRLALCISPTENGYGFQFPSSGKARSDDPNAGLDPIVINKFQFPSGGKARSDLEIYLQ